MMRNINQAGIELIKRWEGLRLHTYSDATGRATIGYGHLITPLDGDDFVNGITLEQATELLMYDIERTATGVIAALKVEISDNQFAACVSFSYNLGVRAFARSTFCRLINKGDFSSASDEIPKWCRAGGVILRGLLNRRLEEQDLFETVDG